LRTQALKVVALGMPQPSGTGRVYGVLVDVPGDDHDSHATVVAMGDGTTSMYSTGSSVVGAGNHEDVRAANRALLQTAAGVAGDLAVCTDEDFPPAAMVRIHVILGGGRRVLDIPAAKFWRPELPMPPLLAAVQDVITAISKHAAQAHPATAAATARGGSHAQHRTSPAAGRLTAGRRAIGDAFSFLVDEFGFNATTPEMNPTWESIRVAYRSASAFVVIDLCELEQTHNVLVGSVTADGHLPGYPHVLPATEHPLRWLPLWSLVEANGGVGPDPGSAAGAELTAWAELLREHAKPLLDGNPSAIEMSSDFLRARAVSLPDLSCGTTPRALVIGQGQVTRVGAYMRATGGSCIIPVPAEDREKLLEVVASAMRGAVAQNMSIVDLGPDPYIRSNGGWIYVLQRAILEQGTR
jgi:hypothetical protein